MATCPGSGTCCPVRAQGQRLRVLHRCPERLDRDPDPNLGLRGEHEPTDRVADKCLAANADGTTPGTKVILRTCNGKSGQKWSFRLDGSVINRSNGLADDVGASATAKGFPIQLWTHLGATNQKWMRG